MDQQPRPSSSRTRRNVASDDEFLTPEELSALLKIPVKTLAAWRNERKGPLPTRMGVHVRYPKSELDQWLAERLAEAERWMAS